MRKSRLSQGKQARLIEHFVVGATARSAFIVAGVDEKTAIYYFHRLRELIALHTADESQQAFDGEIGLEESYFGEQRKGKRRRGAGGKVAVFVLLQRGGKVYAKIIPNAASVTLILIIEKKVAPDSIVYTGCRQDYNALDVSRFKQYRINHSVLFADRENHINGIGNFWSQSKRHLCRHLGIPRDSFPLYSKECEWQFNNPSLRYQLRKLKQWVKMHLA